MKRYKYRAVVRPRPAAEDSADWGLGAVPRRMVLRSADPHGHDNRMFRAMVSGKAHSQPVGGPGQIMVTLWVIGDDAEQGFLANGEHFQLWSGDEVADGVISRRVFI